MNKFIVILALWVTSSLPGYAQTDSLLNVSPVKTFTGDIVDFSTDNLGNIYLITALNQLKKFNEKGDSIASFNDVRRFGKVSGLDATNPLKILVYYKDFGRLVVLDRLLNVRNTIDLRQQNILQMQAYAPSYDNNIWIYDELDSKLKKIDDNGRILLETNDFRQVFESAPTPVSIFDKDGQLYVYDPQKGLATFDYYGALKNNFAIKGIADLQVLDKNTITGRDSAHIILYKPATLQMFSFRLKEDINNYKKIRFDGQRLYALNKQGELLVFAPTPRN